MKTSLAPLIALLAVLLAAPSTLLAADVTVTGHVAELRAYANGRVLFKLSAPAVNPAGCGTNNWYTLDAADGQPENVAGINRPASLLTAAYLAGEEVSVGVHETVCAGYYPAAVHVRFSK